MCEFLQNAPSGRVKLTRDDMFLSRDDLDRLIAAANLDLRTFLRKLESSSELGKALAQRIRNTRRWLRPVTAEEAFLLATALMRSPRTAFKSSSVTPSFLAIARAFFNVKTGRTPTYAR
jgi:hypothetical protein